MEHRRGGGPGGASLRRRVEHSQLGDAEIPSHLFERKLSGVASRCQGGDTIDLVGDSRSEVLLELKGDASLDALGSGVQVRQLLPPRLAIVAADEDELRTLERAPEVVSVFREDVPPDALARLDEPARVFAAGWNERRRPKQRRGEGRPWDAPGFDAP